MKSYINEFIRLECAPDLLRLGLFPNAKEITESFSAYSAVRKFVLPKIGETLQSKNVAIVAIGDGVVPRTAATFAFRSAFDCYSLDPLMKEKNYDVRRLVCMKRVLQESVIDFTKYEHTIAVLVHAHVSIKDTIKYLKTKNLHIVAIPCCVPHELPNVEFLGVRDTNNWSPQNLVKIWTFVGNNG